MTDNVGLLPVTDGGVTVGYTTKHHAVDLGYYKVINTPVMAWNDGTVLKRWTVANGGDMGECILLEHIFGSKKRWSIYMHLSPGSSAHLKQGMTVKMGDVLGKRGNTGYSHGPHLHFAISELVDKNYAYSYTRFYNKCTFRPLDLCYIDDSHDWSNYIDPVQEWPEDVLSVGDYVQILEPGNSRADGKGKTLSKATVGWKRMIIAIDNSKAFPYRVGAGTSTTGYFKSEQLKKL